jgi:ferredoxin-type protein NapG
MKSRREIIRSTLRGIGFLGLGGAIWESAVVKLKASDMVLRPPGAVDEEDFIKACIRCGTCVESCPYDTLKLAVLEDNVAIGTPFFTPRETPCYMCTDVPCVPLCPSGALNIDLLARKEQKDDKDDLDINKARMGVAVIDQESCLAYWGIQCDACYRICPLMGQAITLQFKRNERTGRHAYLEPHVHNDVCTGCGLCEHACVTDKAAIFILPRKIALGEVSAHYIRGWESSDENRLKGLEDHKTETSSPEDQLNNWEKLLDDD